MNNTLQKIKYALVKRYTEKDRINLFDVRPSRFAYYSAYALELVLTAVIGLYLPVGVSIGGFGGFTVMTAVHGVASLAVMLLWSASFKRLLRGTAVLTVIGLVPFIFLPPGYLRFAFGVIGYAGLGGVVTGARCGYAFAANNAERLFGMICTYLASILIRMANRPDTNGVVLTHILPLVLLFLLCFCLFKFREEDFEVRADSPKEDAKGLYWAFAFFMFYFAVDSYTARLADSSRENDYPFMLLGMALPLVLLVAVFFGVRFSTWHLWNMFFLFAIGMGVFAFLATKTGSLRPQYLFCGLSRLGWPLSIYTMGCAQRRFASYKLLKKCTLIFVLLSPVTSMSGMLANRFFPITSLLLR